MSADYLFNENGVPYRILKVEEDYAACRDCLHSTSYGFPCELRSFVGACGSRPGTKSYWFPKE